MTEIDTSLAPGTDTTGDVVVELPRVGWQELANCRGLNPDLFFPQRGEATEQIKAVCEGGVVRADCLEHALVEGETTGIWGGLSEQARRALRRKRNLTRRRAEMAAGVSQ